MLKARLLALLLILLCVLPQTAGAEARFRDMTQDSGLVTGTVFSVLQDRQGYIWLATSNGVERYDGYSFKVFKHKPDDPTSIASDFVKTLYEDPTGRLWLGTYGGGLDLFKPDTGTFQHYRHVQGDSRSIASDRIYSMIGGPHGELIMGMYDAGVDVLDPNSGRIQHYTVASGSGLSDDRIRSLFVDSSGEIWVGTLRGLNELDLAHHLLHAYVNPEGTARSKAINSIAESPDHDLLLATLHGLHSFDPRGGAYDKASVLQWITQPLRVDLITTVTTDDSGDIWICDGGHQLSVIEHNGHALRVFDTKPDSYDSLPSLSIYDIYQDHSGLLWIGTDVGAEVVDPRLLDVGYVTSTALTGRPISVRDHIEQVVEHDDKLVVSTPTDIYKIPLTGFTYGNSAEHIAHIDSDKYGLATALQVNAEDKILVGTEFEWVLVMDGRGRLKDRWHVAAEPGAINASVRGIYEANPDTYLIATFGSGLLEYTPSTRKSIRIVGDSQSSLVRKDQVETMLPLPGDKVLAGTFRGLFEVDLKDGSSKLLSLLRQSTAEPVIQALYQDGSIWVGTYEGLWRLQFDANGTLTDKQYYPQAVTSTSAAILAIAGDRHGDLWLASSNSLLRFDPATGQTLGLSRDQGLPSLEFYSYTHLGASNGWVWFGGPSGLLGFDPDMLRPNPVGPAVVVSEVTSYKRNKLVDLPVTPQKPLQLSYEDAIVTFDMAAADFAQPLANTYSYRMVGFTSEWTPPSRNHLITFTNLNPGRYRLEVKAANNWGTWSSSPAVLDIVVLPPWWRTWWAYTIYLLIIIGSAIAYVYSLKRKITREEAISASLREANEIKTNFVEKLEVQVKEATLELRETLQGVNLKNAELEVAQRRAAEGEQVKSQFLANMSHELRTPLTGVLGYTKLLTSTNLNSEQKDYVSTIRVSSEALLAIINDTLDLSRLEAGKLLIDEVDFDLLELIESTLELLAPIAYQKRLELIRVVPADMPLQVRGDPLRLRQVLTNLLSNAIKFTESGSVCLEAKLLELGDRDAHVGFSVTDTGTGIPESEIGQLFNAYARGKISTRHQVEGTGLGLSICKKLLDLMGGQIGVKSRVGTGTTFNFDLRFRIQKHATPRIQLPRKLSILLYDRHPLSNAAWKASLTRLGAEVREVTELESLMSLQAEAAVLALSERELSHLGELKQKFSPSLPPMLILAPRIERQTLQDLSETLYHRVLSKSAREKTVYLELQSLVQHAIRPDATRPETPAMSQPPADAPLVLVADDNRINRRLLVTMLTHAGFRIAEAGNGIELLDLAARGPFQAAILDIHMPGMDGIETAARLRSIYGAETPPIIAMSADVLPGGEGGPQQGLMDDFLMKPFNENQLVELLHQHLERHQRRHRTAH
ncbi:MAG TPA: two-component regulator propeller domain-containing protein [Gammaproteobacteria bacterium]|jgi:signal transduction histidine kinase/CheY-like chemotaxis protein